VLGVAVAVGVAPPVPLARGEGVEVALTLGMPVADHAADPLLVDDALKLLG